MWKWRLDYMPSATSVTSSMALSTSCFCVPWLQFITMILDRAVAASADTKYANL
jgi:hypothetical protein